MEAVWSAEVLIEQLEQLSEADLKRLIRNTENRLVRLRHLLAIISLIKGPPPERVVPPVNVPATDAIDSASPFAPQLSTLDPQPFVSQERNPHAVE